MNSVSRTVWLIVACLVLTTAGCNRSFSFERTFDLEPGDVQSFSVDPPRHEQKVRVTFKSREVPIDIYVGLQRDLDPATKAIKNYKAPQSMLATQLKAREGSLEVTIPARTAYGVIVSGGNKDTTVEVRLAGK